MDLPIDVQRLIISYTIFLSTYEERMRYPLRLVCKQWHSILREKYTWSMIHSFKTIKIAEAPKNIWFCWRDYVIIQSYPMIVEKDGKEIMRCNQSFKTANYLALINLDGYWEIYYKNINESSCFRLEIKKEYSVIDMRETSLGLLYRVSFDTKINLLRGITSSPLPDGINISSLCYLGYNGIYDDHNFYRWHEQIPIPISFPKSFDILSTGTPIDLIFGSIFFPYKTIAYNTITSKVIWEKKGRYISVNGDLVLIENCVIDLLTGIEIYQGKKFERISAKENEYILYY